MATILHRLARWAREEPQSVAQRYKENGKWKHFTAQEYSDRVFHLAVYLESVGFQKDDVSAILSYNRPEWTQSDLAPGLLGGISAGLYPNASLKDIQFVLKHTEAKIFFVQNEEYYRKAVGNEKLPETVQKIIVFEGDPNFDPKALSLDHALQEGRRLVQGKKMADYLKKVNPLECAYLIYTSGTTGTPKGVMLSHDNLAYASDLAVNQWLSPYRGREMMFSFLPLCHIAEKLQNVGVGTTLRYTVSYCSKFENLAQELVEVQPTVFLAVPRVWEKMMEGVRSKVSKATGTKKKLASWAFEVAKRVSEAKYSAKLPSIQDVIQLKLADKLVLSKVRHALGFARLKLCASGAAVLPAHVAKWFRLLGIEILEDYGQSESSAIITMTSSGQDAAGTIGKPVRGTEFKIAEDGEILTKGRHVFLGYFKDPESTAKTLIDGWLHTGDLGNIGPDGLVRIVGRKKEIMKTSGGKMIAPTPIEEALKESPLISQACIVGDGRKYVTALLTLSDEKLQELQKKSGAISGEKVVDKDTLREVQNHVDEVNHGLANFEKVKYFTVIAREFSLEKEEMTPSMKMKRNVVESHFQPMIDSMYAGSAHHERV